jgi:autotransporter-associated beta strand protein
LVLAVFSAVIAAGAGSAQAATIIYEPFADTDASLAGNTPGTGLTGTWTASAGFTVPSGSLTYGTLPVSGNQVVYNGGSASSSASLSSALSAAGLLSDGKTLWFSMVVNTPRDGGSNPDTGFAIATDAINGTNNIPLVAGQGIGWAIKNDLLRACTWNNAKAQSAGISVATNTTKLIVGEIIWGADGAATDTINLYLPDTSLNKGAVKTSQSAVLNQVNFDLITSGLKANYLYGMDEIRFGTTYEDVLIFPTLSWDLNGAAAGAGADGSGAAAGTWDAAGTNWNPELDGTGATGAWLPGYVARFAAGSDATGTYTVEVDGTQDIWGLTFDEGTVTLTPKPITGGALRLTKNSAEVDVASGVTATVASPITQDDPNSRALTKKGAGTLILSGANIYSGGTNVRAGTLVLGASDALPATSAVIVGGNVAGMTATLDANGHSLTIASLTLGGATATSGAAVTTGAAALTLGGNVTYDNANNPLGATIRGKLDLGAADRTFTINNSTNTAAELTVSADITGTVGLIKEGAGTLVLSGNNVGATGGMSINAGAVQFNSTAAVNGTARDVTVNAGGAVVFGPSFETGADIPTALSARIVAASQGAIATDNYAATNFDFATPGLTGASLGAVGNVTYTGTLTPNGTTYRLGGGGGTLTMANANAITGTGNSLVVVGPGTVVITNANDADGTTTVSAGGTLQIGTGSTTGSLNPSSAITLDGALIFNRSNTVTQGTDFSPASINGGGSLTQAGTGTLILNAANTYAGLTTVNAGVLKLGAAGDGINTPLGTTAAGTSVTSGAALDLGGVTLSTAEALTLNGTGVSSGGALTNSGAAATYSGPITLGSASSIVTNGDIVLSNIGTITGATFALTLGGTGNGTIAGGIGTTSGTLTKSGSGTWTLSGNNTGTGGVTLSGGTLNVNNNHALGNSGTITLSGGTIDNTSGAAKVNSVASAITLGGNFAFSTAAGTSANSLSLGTGAVTNSGSRTITLNGSGVLTFGGIMTNTLAGNNTLTVNNGSGTTSTSAVNFGGFVLSGTASTARTDTITGTGNVNITGPVRDVSSGTTSSSLIKSGTGTLTLSGTNTYTGTTTVNGGTLLINSPGSLNIASAVTVNTGGTLGGDGTINGAVTVNTGGTLSPGAGTLQAKTSVAMATDSTYTWQFDGTTADKVVITGGLTLISGWNLALVAVGGVPTFGSTYDLFTYTGGFTGSFAGDIISTPAGWPTAAFAQDETGATKRIYLKFGQPGDTNNDGVTDAADFITLKKNFGTSTGAGETAGDFNTSGTVNWADLSILMSNMGAGVTAPATAPEPCSAILLMFGAAALLRRRKAA